MRELSFATKSAGYEPELTLEQYREQLDQATSRVAALVEHLYGFPYGVVLKGPGGKQLRLSFEVVNPHPMVA
jgi:hypothetical protein